MEAGRRQGWASSAGTGVGARWGVSTRRVETRFHAGKGWRWLGFSCGNGELEEPEPAWYVRAIVGQETERNLHPAPTP